LHRQVGLPTCTAVLHLHFALDSVTQSGKPGGMAYQRVPVDSNKALGPGTYEIVSAHQSGDVSRVTRSDLERALQARYGSGVKVLDWGKKGNDLVIRLQVTAAPTASTSGTQDPWAITSAYGGAGCGSRYCPQPMSWYTPDDLIQPAFLPALPAIFTAAAVIAILYLTWRIVATIKETVQLVPEPARSVAVTGSGVGLAALGLGVLALAVWPRGRR
jgi:hypothetical protein